MAFRCDSSPLVEMQRMEKLAQRDPESAVNAVANGKLMVEWARDGRLRELQCAIAHMAETPVLWFYSVRMFRAACHARRLDVLRFMLAHSFDLQQTCMRDVLHSVIEEIHEDASAEAVQPLIRFLLVAGVDVNWQRKGDLYTALHVACRKNLYGIAYLLILYDADVNAIAADDEMPLLCAERMALLGRDATPADRHTNRHLVTLLEDCGARRTWRKIRPMPAPTTPSPTPRILSFSDSTLMWSCPVSGDLPDDEETLAHAFSEVIQLDTPASPW